MNSDEFWKLKHVIWRPFDSGTLPTSSEIDWPYHMWPYTVYTSLARNNMKPRVSKAVIFTSTLMKSPVACCSVDRKHGQQTQNGMMPACAPRSSATRSPTRFTHTHHTPKSSCAQHKALPAKPLQRKDAEQGILRSEFVHSRIASV